MTHKSLLSLSLLIILLVACSGDANTPPPPTPTRNPTALYIDPSQTIGPISPLVYGSNYGPWLAIPVGVLDAYEQSGLRFLRFPGGRWGDENNLRELQIDQFMTLLGQIDGEASISVRLLGGTPEQAAEIVRYTNIESGYGVVYWSIGNEPSLYATLQNEPEWDTTHYNQQWRQFAEAMKAVDPNIKLLGPNIHQFRADENQNPKDANGKDWLREFLLANGDLVDVVTIHRYPFPADMGTPAPTPEELLANSAEWNDIIPTLRRVIQETTGQELPVGIMEINSNWTNGSGLETTPDSFLSAIWWGDVLARLIQQRVEMVTHFALQSNPGRAGWGLLARNEPRPGYYVYQLFQQFGEELLLAESPDPQITILAARRADGKLTLLLLNRAFVEKTAVLQLPNLTTTAPAEQWRFDETHLAERLDDIPLADGSSLTLPPTSMTLYVITEQP